MCPDIAIAWNKTRGSRPEKFLPTVSSRGYVIKHCERTEMNNPSRKTKNKDKMRMMKSFQFFWLSCSMGVEAEISPFISSKIRLVVEVSSFMLSRIRLEVEASFFISSINFLVSEISPLDSLNMFRDVEASSAEIR